MYECGRVCVCVPGLFCRSPAAVCFVNFGFLFTPKTNAVVPSRILFKGVFEHKVSVRGLHVVAWVLFMLDGILIGFCLGIWEQVHYL